MWWKETLRPRNNEIILTTIVLSMYEDTVMSPSITAPAITSHLQGALALVGASAVKDFKDPTSTKLHSALLTRVVWSLTFVAAIHTIIHAIYSVDKELEGWGASLSPGWECTEVTLPDDAIDLWSQIAHTYPSFWVANDWAHCRTLKILTNNLHLHACRFFARGSSAITGPPSVETDIAAIHTRLRGLVDDICASVPYHLGYRQRMREEICCFPRFMSVCHFVWPLYIAGITEGVGQEQKLWIASDTPTK
ncbi:hypothetical protein FE257_001979 [Aspergillus nanangensis]|uniref:Transcription factor domain-containing protein n=1 Tax=Aspergillus nanangensis TaxID=2582783 RepID=A0AAD4GP93_ASPNN|nr:hypothetical protein FE257_001979 [Aspergillus nanangensis]